MGLDRLAYKTQAPKKAKNSITINDLRSQTVANQWVRKCGCSSMVGIQPPMRLTNPTKNYTENYT